MAADNKRTSKQRRGKPKKTASKGHKGQKDGRISYEIKLILLIAFTLMSLIALFSGATGIFGKVIKEMYTGFFSYAGFILPFIIFFIAFMAINRNMAAIKYRYIFSLVMLLLGIMMLIFSIHVGGMAAIHGNKPVKIGMDFFLNSMVNGISLKGAGIVGDLVGSLIYNVAGVVGTYLSTVVFMLIAAVTGTSFSVDKLYGHTRTAVVNTARKSGEIATSVIEAQKDRVEMRRLSAEQPDLGKTPSFLHPQPSPRQDISSFDSDAFEFAEQPDMPGDDRGPSDNGRDEGIMVSTYYDGGDSDKEFDTDDDFEFQDAISFDPYVKKKTLDTETDDSQAIEVGHPEDIVDDVRVDIGAEKPLPKPYRLPPVSLLNKVPATKSNDKTDLYVKASILEDTLKSFGVDIKVTHITRGPAITMYELMPSPGVKISKIVALSDDIALSLAAPAVRIIAPIPGKSAVGVEIPNDESSIVSLREVIEDESFRNSSSKLVFTLGKDIHGKTIVGDLSKMPHMLVAGSTGSGKSVCVNTLITSILFNASPDEVKFLMIDPKVVELSIYNGIPHLLLPVVTDPKKAAVALNWAVAEMTRRYQLFAESATKDVDSYNRKTDEGGGERLPKIVVIIDELADLMMVAPNQIEDAICRLAQMARAAGIHLLVATQRPSVDVITGLIKANIPSRIAFAVSSQIDSRTILDMGGAEKLLGKGDMLYYPIGANKPSRVQGAYVSDSEVSSVIQFIKSQSDGETEYNEDIVKSSQQDDLTGDADELLAKSIEFCISQKQASASMLQRKFRVGYNRAARIVDQMEERGIVGPSQGSKPRELLVDETFLDGGEES